MTLRPDSSHPLAPGLQLMLYQGIGQIHPKRWPWTHSDELPFEATVAKPMLIRSLLDLDEI